MTRHIVAALVPVILIAAAPAPKEDEAKKEQEKLQGTWRNVSYEIGKAIITQELNMHCVIEKDTFTIKEGDKIISKGTFTLDPSAKPKAINLTFTEGQTPETKGKKVYGIYDVDKESLTFCLPEGSEEKDRPTAFVTKKGERQEIFRFKKQK